MHFGEEVKTEEGFEGSISLPSPHGGRESFMRESIDSSHGKPAQAKQYAAPSSVLHARFAQAHDEASVLHNAR